MHLSTTIINLKQTDLDFFVSEIKIYIRQYEHGNTSISSSSRRAIKLASNVPFLKRRRKETKSIKNVNEAKLLSINKRSLEIS
jgi:hypothetical protein